ncbi:hypothetical protein CI102_5724 [Trichoderma harzianum]|nr:hypothetical protein CI102_5724 [Trichoderma harzianum]
MRRCSAESSTNTRMERYGYEAFGGISAVSTIAAMPTIVEKTHLCSIKYEVASACLPAACTCWAHDRGRGSHSGHQAGVRESRKRSKVMLLTAEYYLVILIYSLFSHLVSFFFVFFLQPLFPNHTSNLLFSALIQSRSNPVSLSRWWRRSLPLFFPRNL